MGGPSHITLPVSHLRRPHSSPIFVSSTVVFPLLTQQGHLGTFGSDAAPGSPPGQPHWNLSQCSLLTDNFLKGPKVIVMCSHH